MIRKKDTQAYHNLHRALNELVVRLVRNQFSEHDEEEFFRFAREADRRQLLGFYLDRQQRMIDEGCDPVSAYHWSYCDVLNHNL